MRPDNRLNNQMRRVKITRNVMKFAEGSALIEVGDTRVLCTATIENRTPPFLKDRGEGWVTAEYAMLPRACMHRVPRDSTRGRGSARSLEIQRLIGRCLRAVVDRGFLGERTILLDCDVLQADGGTRTASVTGAFVALYDAVSRLKRDGLIEQWPINAFCAGISAGIVRGEPLLDMCYEEDSACEVDLNVVMADDEQFIELQVSGEDSRFSKETLDQLVAMSGAAIEKLIGLQKRVLGVGEGTIEVAHSE
ncbi:MAG: ribonuclease PH [Candidatus Hydrogenedentes bacterium]|nr:ribonuclease PH [Candidatus Hydrogenedentota bacterium]